jgi:hypothetical protein
MGSKRTATADKQPGRSMAREARPLAQIAEPDERQLQLELGRLNLVPLPRLFTRPFRTELTVEQNSLFVSNNYKGDDFVREEEVLQPESGEVMIRRMMVGFVAKEGGHGVLRQSHQDVFYKVLEMWGQQGYKLAKGANGKVYGSLDIVARDLVEAVFASANVRSYERTQKLLHELQTVPIVLENVYTWQGQLDRETFKLLSEVRWSERRLSKQGESQSGSSSTLSILLSSFVTEGFLARHIKVLLGKPYDSLQEGPGRRSENARLLYPLLDRELGSKPRYEISLDAVAKRYGLARSEFRSKRKERFEPAAKILDGQLIQEGAFVMRVALELSADGSDYVLVARREPVHAGAPRT